MSPRTRTVRETARAAAAAEIMGAALELFERAGYESTTIEQIADAAGISRRTFFRYFATKEDVLATAIDTHIEYSDSLQARPAKESAWAAVRATLLEVITHIQATRGLEALRMIFTSPPVHERYLRRLHAACTPVVIDELVKRLPSSRGGDPALRASAIMMACVSAFDVALKAWVAQDGARDLVEIFDETFDAIRSR